MHFTESFYDKKVEETVNEVGKQLIEYVSQQNLKKKKHETLSEIDIPFILMFCRETALHVKEKNVEKKMSD